LRIKMYGSTNVGRVRKENQDAIYFDEIMNFGVVADGIGGRAGGKEASAIAVRGLRRAVVESEMIRHDQADSFLVNALDAVNSEIIKVGREDVSKTGMGTTVNAVMFFADKAHIVHVGDSRTYLYDRGHLFQLTIDHNVKTLLRRGQIEQSDVLPRVSKDALVRALGLSEQFDPDIYTLQVRTGQILLTCSDGLYSMVEDRKILHLLNKHAHKPNELPKHLIDAANQGGGRDNITVLLSIVRAG
jgi:serine/threonine protein phosphatase PrpC